MKSGKESKKFMGIVVIGAVFVDIKGYPLSTYIPGGRNAGRMEQVHGGVSLQRGRGYRQRGAPAHLREPCR